MQHNTPHKARVTPGYPIVNLGRLWLIANYYKQHYFIGRSGYHEVTLSSVNNLRNCVLFSGEQEPEFRTKAETVKIVRGLTENRGQKTAKSVLRRLSRNRKTAFQKVNFRKTARKKRSNPQNRETPCPPHYTGKN